MTPFSILQVHLKVGGGFPLILRTGEAEDIYNKWETSTFQAKGVRDIHGKTADGYRYCILVDQIACMLMGPFHPPPDHPLARGMGLGSGYN